MPKELFTFWYYINSTQGQATENFKALFANDIEHLPNRIVSSKRLRSFLCIDTLQKQQTFQKVFMDYFKMKLTKDN